MANNLPAAKNREITRREKEYAALCPALREKVDFTIKWSQDDTRYNLLSRHDLGVEIQDVYDEKTNNGTKTYGERAFKKIARFSGEDEGMLRTCVRMAQTWTKAQLTEITEMVMMDKVTPISYSHVRWLLTIDTPQGRQEALNKTLENCWSSAELSKYIQELYNRPKSNAGRTAAPKTLDGLILQQRQYAEDFEGRYAKIWSHEQYSLAAQVQKLKPEQVTEELAQRVGELAARQRQLATQANDMAAKTEQQYKRLLQQLKRPEPLPSVKKDKEPEEEAPRKPRREQAVVGSRTPTVPKVQW